MATENHIRNPLEWVLYQFGGDAGAGHGAPPIADREAARLTVARIGAADLREALRKGFIDFAANRSDVLLLCLIYPFAGIALAYAATGQGLVPMIFPLISGFALLGPIAGIGLYEMSRRREQGHPVNAGTPLGVLHSPAFGRIVTLALLLFAVFLAWLVAAYVIYLLTLGPEPPASIRGFAGDTLTTAAGWAMIVVGLGIGGLFAVLALAVGAFSFPLLLDRNVTVWLAMEMSVQAVLRNPGTLALWGLIVAAGLLLGSIPLLAGLIVVLPVLGHATWHLYRRVLPR
ncbi:Uncharacterized membrane protein [Tistlia consotensis]|uniref:Uncharacterized membrane protein n=1 Tax=Tistlia consotensis USBA 355 TaxID=560819 RepID=A0A1Y6BM47_9PROT|nr:DUF2189 domain-containing protein [Tistlia consotensis]SMF18152.1 Uncharacterized membrane protein [Tistlia consotensis USBA 355]SNR39888.1 Uncharacterized membrane protein [Tistlia consotensis]